MPNSESGSARYSLPGLALTPALLLAACASSSPDAGSADSTARAAARQPAAPEAHAPDRQLAAALERALERGRWKDLEIVAECLGEEDGRTPYWTGHVFSDGTAVWNGTTQVELSRETLLGLLERFEASGFASFAPTYGRDPTPPEPPAVPRVGEDDGGERQPRRVTCWVGIRLDGAEKHARQYLRGTQHEPLLSLAHEILRALRPRAAAGVTAEDLAAGLELVASGELDPRMLRVQLVRRPADGAGADSGWIFEMIGREAVYDPAGEAPPSRFELDAETVRRLAAEISEAGFAELPVNLWAPEYSDLRVRVLRHGGAVQARPFAGMTATTHGERQAAFDRLLDRVEALAGRVAAEGR